MAEIADRGQQLETILQAVADAILIVDAQGIVRYANPAATGVFGRKTSELLGHDFGFPIVAGETTEVDILRPGGSVITGELRTVATTWDDEPAIVASIRDITTRKRAAEAAQKLLAEQLAREQAEENERHARFLVEAANALSASLDYSVTLNDLARVCVEYYADWCVIDVIETNRELKRVAVAQADPRQAELARILGEVRPEVHPLPHEADVLRTGESMLITDIDRDIGDEQYRKVIDEITPQSAMMVPLYARRRVVGVIAFISSRSRQRYTHADLNIATELGRYAGTAVDNSRLYQEAQRGNEAKSNFLAVMSHELRTPLNAVIGYSDLLTMGVPAPIPPAAAQHVGRIRSSARHLLRLIEEILTFSRMEAGREWIDCAEVKIGDVGREVAGIIKPLAAERGLEFRVELPQPDYAMHTDPGKLEQILLNLLSNAVKFTPGGSIGLTVVRVDDWTHFHVKDSGIGIAPEHLERIFDPFWQAEQSRTRRAEGTGLGLSVARRLAQLLGGNLVVQSTAHKGSTFTLQLPNRAPRLEEER
jgi:signal transduction histidine kinase